MTDCRHPERPAVARCVICGKTLCDECRKKYKRRNFCPACWPKRKKPSFRSPTLAFLLSLLPGIGHIYSGAFLRGLIFPAAIFSCVAGQGLFLSPLVAFLLLFCAWDARMAALKRNGREADRLTDEGIMIPGALGVKRGCPVEADWMLWGGAALLAFLFLWLPVGPGIVLAPWMVWGGFGVALVASLLLGSSGGAGRVTVETAPAVGNGGNDVA